MTAQSRQTTNQSIESSWATVAAMTSAMKSAADLRQWPEIVGQAAARHRHLMAHFEQFPVGPATAEFYRQRLGELLSGEQALQDLVRNARKSLMSEGLAINHGNRAVGAYLQSARR